MIYLDTSALLKLARHEPESAAFAGWLASHPAPLASSALVRTEAHRALHRHCPDATRPLPGLLATINQIPISDEILDAAAAFPTPELRSLDAIHLATAIKLHTGLSSFVTYDKRLAAVATDHGLPVVSPR